MARKHWEAADVCLVNHWPVVLANNRHRDRSVSSAVNGMKHEAVGYSLAGR